MKAKRGSARVAASLLAACVLAGAGCTAQPEDPAPVASVDEPRVLTDDQAETLSAMPFKNYAAGIVAFEGQLFGGENGDMPLAGWVDFTEPAGYAKVSPQGAPPIIVAWDESEVAFLDLEETTVDDALPPLLLPDGDWQRAPLQAETSELTRMLAALLRLSADRPDNPLLLKQNGARYLGTDEVAGETTDRFSGVAAGGGAGGEADLGTQYWLDANGDLVRFGFRAAGSSLSVVDFRPGEAEELPEQLPSPRSVSATTGTSGSTGDGG